jgi:dTDP-4-amino-4,6-dideoxygalactose transaminase
VAAGAEPVADYIGSRAVALPLFPGMRSVELDAVTDTVLSYFRDGGV